MSNGIIYMAVNTVTNMIYIGQTAKTLDSRKYGHYYQANRKEYKTHFHNALLAYDTGVFEWDILESVPIENLHEAEVFWIAYYKSIGAKLYNHTIGGDGMRGHHHNQITRDKISRANGGKKRSKEFADNLSKMKSGNRSLDFIDDCGNVYYGVTNIQEFARSLDVDPSNLNKVALGIYKSAKGIRLYEGGDYHST